MKKLLFLLLIICSLSAHAADPADLRYEIYNQLHMDTLGTNQVSTVALDTIITMGYNVIAKDFWSYLGDTTLPLVDGQMEYGIPPTLLEISDGETIKLALHKKVATSGSPPPMSMRPVPGDSLFNVIQESQPSIKTEEKFNYVFVLNSKFWLYPAPAVTGSAESLLVVYRAKGVSTIPSAYRDHLRTWCCWRVQAKRFGMESPQSLAWQAKYEKMKVGQ